MFTINYEFQDGGPLYKCTFPKKEHSDHNIFIIRGTNDQGKTTTLNMVALGLYAQESFSTDKGIISDSLRAKMDYLSSDELDILKFDFTIKSIDEQTEIFSEYNNGLLNTKLNGEPVGVEHLTENIQILYDVPDDPLVKLQSSVRLIKENLMDYERYLKRYHQDLDDITTKMLDFKTKENTIKRNTEKLNEIQKNLNTTQELMDRAKPELIKLDIANKVLSYFEIFESIYQTNEQMTLKKAQRTNLKRKGIGGGTPKFKDQVIEFNSVNDEIKKSFTSIKIYRDTLANENLESIKKIENKLNGLYSPQDVFPKEIDKWTNTIAEILLELKSDPLNDQLEKEEKQSELIIKVMAVLREYLSLEINVPGTNLQNIFSFYTELDNFNKEIEPKILKKRDLGKVIDEFSRLSVLLSDLKVKRANIPDVDEDQMYEYEQIEKQIKKLGKKLTDLQIQLEKYDDPTKSLSEDEVIEIMANPGQREQYKRTKKEFDDLQKEIGALNVKETTLIARIEGLGELKSPIAYDEDWLQEESDKCNKLISKVSKWKKVLELVNFRKNDLGINYDQSKELFDTLSVYFAKILKNVYFEKKSWDVEKVDLIKRQYIVKGRKPIKFVQMGTGHTALNSILSRIKQSFGGKKKIILVDEIGHMDEENIGILVDEIKGQIKNGETVFALITIADSTVSEVTWEPVSV